MLIKSIRSESEQDTFKAGADLARLILDSSISSEKTKLSCKFSDNTVTVALFGDLGSGKTVFVRGMASVLAPDAAVQSPSYTIVNEYMGNPVNLYHFDMYRITGEDDLYSIGFYDYSDAVLAIEWSEKISYALPPVFYRVAFSSESDTVRQINIELVKDNTNGEEAQNEDSFH